MVDFQTEKDIVRAFHAGLDATHGAALADVITSHTADGYLWRGYHPFNELTGANAVAGQFWQPLKTSLSRLQRRDDIFFAGRNEIDGFESTWVVAMGHLMGLFDAPWLGIPPTGKMAFLRRRLHSGRWLDIQEADIRPY